MNNQWRFKGNELKYVSDVIASGEGSSTSGNYNSLFEQEFAKKSNAKYAVTFNSGTSNLTLTTSGQAFSLVYVDSTRGWAYKTNTA